MINALRTLLEAQPLMALFLTIAIGTVVGALSFRGFSLGIGAVLFVALVIGWLAPKSAPAPAVGTLGLALFLYAIGVHYGRDFFEGLASTDGRKANLLALIGVLSAAVVMVVMIRCGVAVGYALGLFAGSGTSTATLQAAIQRLGNDDPAVGYSVAYPFGVAGPILLLQLVFSFLKPRIDAPASATQELLEISVRNRDVIGKRLGDVVPTLPAGVQIIAVRDDRNRPATPEFVLAEDVVVLASGASPAALQEARQLLGESAAGRITSDRRDLDYLSVFVSRPALVGATLRDLAPPDDARHSVIQVRRGDADLLAQADLVLEFGDRVGVLAERSSFPAVRTFFGDSIKGTAEFSYVSVGLGIALGFLLGAISFPIPGVGGLAIGVAGVLVVGLIVGRWRRTRHLNWTIPLSASLVLRHFGLTVFLAQVGLASGPKFAATVADTGFLFLGLGAILLLAIAVPILVLGVYVFRMPFDQVGGIVAGACGNAAILGYVNKTVGNDRPDVAYAMIFPGMTIVKILVVEIVPSWFG